MAADSLEIEVRSQRSFGISTIERRRCKIVQTERTFFVVAGAAQLGAINFFAYSIAAESIARNTTIQLQANDFQRTVEGRIPAISEFMKKQDPARYADWLHKDRPIIEVAFVGFDDTGLNYCDLSFGLDSTGVPRKTDTTNWRAETGANNYAVAGFKDHIKTYMASHPRWPSMGPVEAARTFLRVEIRNNPHSVGDPISILGLTRREGAKWIEQGVCPAIQSQNNNPDGNRKRIPPRK